MLVATGSRPNCGSNTVLTRPSFGKHVQQAVQSRGDQSRAGDGEHPGPDHPASDAPAHRRQPVHGSDADDCSRDRVGRTRPVCPVTRK